jgi:hypothetical protein
VRYCAKGRVARVCACRFLSSPRSCWLGGNYGYVWLNGRGFPRERVASDRVVLRGTMRHNQIQCPVQALPGAFWTSRTKALLPRVAFASWVPELCVYLAAPDTNKVRFQTCLPLALVWSHDLQDRAVSLVQHIVVAQQQLCHTTVACKGQPSTSSGVLPGL